MFGCSAKVFVAVYPQSASKVDGFVGLRGWGLGGGETVLMLITVACLHAGMLMTMLWSLCVTYARNEGMR